MKYVSLFLRICRMEKIVHPAWDQPNQLFHLFQIWFSRRSRCISSEVSQWREGWLRTKGSTLGDDSVPVKFACNFCCLHRLQMRSRLLSGANESFLLLSFFLQFTRSANKQYSLQTTQLDLDCELLVENLSRWITTFDIISTEQLLFWSAFATLSSVFGANF